ncbi:MULTISPECIES: ANTAR domain-containing protein [Thermocrispum]|jgi:AmiR/NasT family two-component response regulator|uniref:ANTAR domain-containing protein n=1 Tax=Thermocrispum agreste TaxID=37925 RepID=A0A2W4J4B7_9PSEU|nr:MULTISPECIES: ANTAR domain-containing protein [Thermocrispum]PZM93992.1 MAG: ANTAR domain-containing protein [Thermocrispum agreste]
MPRSREAELLKTVQHYKTLSEQLQHALESRIAIEQAKGILSERYRITVDEAFQLLRSYCRAHNLKIADAARALTVRPEKPTAPTGHAVA